MKKLLSLFALTILIFSIEVLAHSGRTNSDGCHNNRKTGDYHCHNSKVKTYAPKYQLTEKVKVNKSISVKEKVLLDTCKESMNGKINFKTPENGLIDCLTKTDAIAYEYAKDWQKAVGKALYYGSQTNRKAGIVLICKSKNECRKYTSKINDIAIKYDMAITVWNVIEK